MINIISAILFSLSANLDNIAIGISYELKKINISAFSMIIISIFTTFFTFLSMYIGNYIPLFFNSNFANSLGAYLLITLGLYTLIKDFYNKKDKTIHFDKMYRYSNITIKDMLLIIFILSTNNIAAGIAASATGVGIFLTLIFSLFFSFIFLFIGKYIAKKSTSIFIKKYCNIISSIILIILGIIQI